MRPRLFVAIGAIAFSTFLAGAASAATVFPGIPVLALSGGGSSTLVPGSIVDRDITSGPEGDSFDLDGDSDVQDAVKFFIPLRDSTSGVYGDVPTGQAQDWCWEYDCGGELTMYMRFEVDDDEVGTPHFMRIYFEDLDLINVNDPDRFLESIAILNSSGTELYSFDTYDALLEEPTPNPDGSYDTGDFYIVADEDEQSISLFNIPVSTDPFFAQFVFQSSYEKSDSCYYSNYYHKWKNCRKLYNTPEYLRAEIEAWPPPVPVPAALPLFISGLAALGFVGARRRKNQKAPDA